MKPCLVCFCIVTALPSFAFAQEQLTALAVNGCKPLDTASNDVGVLAQQAAEREACVRANLSAERLKRMEAAGNADAAALASFRFDNAAEPLLQKETRVTQLYVARAEFKDMNWGVGFGYSLGDEDFIEEAELVDGVVRVTKDNTDKARVLFEFHKFFWCKDTMDLDKGCGPFVAVAATNEEVLSGVGMGFMWGWRALKEPAGSEGFSVGVGVVLDNDIKSLADGFDEGQPLPPGETEIRFETQSRWSTLIFVTRTF